MGSPRGNLNNPYYQSPYARQSYPSMEEGFIPLSFSSPYKAEQSYRPRGRGTPAKAYKHRNWHNNNRKNRGLSSQQKDFNSYLNRPSSGSDWQPNQSGERKFYKKPTWGNDISDYIHPSMFEDPWKELVERHQALGGCDMEEDQAAGKTAGEGTSWQEPQAADKTTSSDVEEQSIDRSACESICGSEEQGEGESSVGNRDMDK